MRGLASICASLVLLLSLPGASLAQDAERAPAALQGVDQPPLEGTAWRVTHVGARQARPVGPEMAAWLTLRDGKLSGSTGCLEVAGRYTRLGPLLELRPRYGGRIADACTEQEALVARGMRRALAAVTTYGVTASEDGPQLVLRDRDGGDVLWLAPDDAAVLEGAEWRLAAYTSDGRTVPAQVSQPGLLIFDRERRDAVRRSSSGALSGSTGCNGVVGEYVRAADVISVAGLDHTEAPCPSALLEQEEAMLAVLGATALRLDLPPDRLILMSADSGERLEFVTAAPLEGTTWLLTRIDGSEPPQDPVTLRLLDGVLSGEGPCGPYRASYVNDGVFLTIDDMEGAPSDTCDQPAREADLLSALERTVMLDRPNGQLRLLDIRGRTLARFKRPSGP